MKIGWVGNYKRSGKNFGLAYQVCKENDFDLEVAGPKDSALDVRHEDMPDFYHSIDCLLVTSYWEAHPLIVYEALACGTPVAVHQYVGDCYRNNLRGVAYYTEWNVDVITRALEAVEENYDKLSEMAVTCIQEKWMWPTVAPQYLNMFEKTTGKVEPHVTFLIDEEGWSWGFMAKEIKKYVYPDLEIFTLIGKTMDDFTEHDWSHTDLVINHPWQLTYDTELYQLIPSRKQIVSVNGPAFLVPRNYKAFSEMLPRSIALSTVSQNIIDLLRFVGKPIYYTTRGIDTDVFKPKKGR